MWWRRQASDPVPTPQEALDERLSAYLDDEVTDAERAEVEALLASDAGARAYLDDLQHLTSALASLEPVRAPRSFAIPAPTSSGAPAALRGVPGGVPGAGRLTAVLVRRMEWAMRASAAAAALLFVVALTYNPGDSGNSAGLVSTAGDGAALYAQQESAATAMAPGASDAPDAGAADARAPAHPDRTGEGVEDAAGGGAGVTGSEEPPSDAPADDGEMTTMMAPGDAATTDGTSDGDASRTDGVTAGTLQAGDPVDETPTFRSPESGTFDGASSSDGVGGIAPALGALAILLAVLSVMVARKDERSSPDRR